jgi:uridine kinase
VRPAFPFEYIRYDEFIDAVRSLASTGECSYAPFDYETLTVSAEPRTVTLARPVIVEGVSALNPALTPHYGVKLWVDSDRASVLRTAELRGGGVWLEAWRTLFLPSMDLYMRTQPERRADIVVLGRGAVGD